MRVEFAKSRLGLEIALLCKLGVTPASGTRARGRASGFRKRRNWACKPTKTRRQWENLHSAAGMPFDRIPCCLVKSKNTPQITH